MEKIKKSISKSIIKDPIIINIITIVSGVKYPKVELDPNP